MAKGCKWRVIYSLFKNERSMNKKLYYNPLNTSCKSVTGAVRQGEELTITVFSLKGNRKEELTNVCMVYLEY